MLNVIKILKKNIGNTDVTTIHFDNKRQLQITKPYFHLIGKGRVIFAVNAGVF